MSSGEADSGLTGQEPETRSGGRRASREMGPAERTLRARAAAYKLHSLRDGRELTANARRAFDDRFVDQVDPERVLPEAERRRRAECARRAYFAALAAKSVKARRRTTRAAPGRS